MQRVCSFGTPLAPVVRVFGSPTVILVALTNAVLSVAASTLPAGAAQVAPHALPSVLIWTTELAVNAVPVPVGVGSTTDTVVAVSAGTTNGMVVPAAQAAWGATSRAAPTTPAVNPARTIHARLLDLDLRMRGPPTGPCGPRLWDGWARGSVNHRGPSRRNRNYS